MHFTRPTSGALTRRRLIIVFISINSRLIRNFIARLHRRNSGRECAPMPVRALAPRLHNRNFFIPPVFLLRLCARARARIPCSLARSLARPQLLHKHNHRAARKILLGVRFSFPPFPTACVMHRSRLRMLTFEANNKKIPT